MSEEKPTSVFDIPKSASKSIPDMMQILELRFGVEIEAAALAAERRTNKHMTHLWKRYDAIEKEFDQPQHKKGMADFKFHQSIARATTNPYFDKFISFLGQHYIPRLQLGLNLGTSGPKKDFHDKIQAEHLKIVQAIEAKNEKTASNAMKLHLKNSMLRYKILIENSKVNLS